MNLENKHILVGVTGGIAAYKSPALVRRLRDAGAQVRVVMTQSAHHFVSATTFQAVSGHRVPDGLWRSDSEHGMAHIELARWADLVLIAPATADIMAKLAHGFSDDLLTTLCLATEAPLALAPAMNRVMWSHPATQANRQCLETRSVRFLGPGAGALAEQESGAGRMLEPLEIVASLSADSGALAGVRVLITAGPTREPVDAVRYIGNRSSGKMGYSIAAAAARLGAQVTLVSGPVEIPKPAGVTRELVETAAQMHAATMNAVADSDIFIATAAVADYAPEAPVDYKIKKTGTGMDVKLVRTVDILAEVGALNAPPFTVGFAAETQDVEANAMEKINKKHIDMIAANQVGPQLGFETDDNALTVLWRGGRKALALAPKNILAGRLMEIVTQRYKAVRQS